MLKINCWYLLWSHSFQRTTWELISILGILGQSSVIVVLLTGSSEIWKLRSCCHINTWWLIGQQLLFNISDHKKPLTRASRFGGVTFSGAPWWQGSSMTSNRLLCFSVSQRLPLQPDRTSWSPRHESEWNIWCYFLSQTWCVSLSLHL